MATPESFQQLALRVTDAVQHAYEVIRGVLLADETIGERSRVTGVDRDTISEKARRFLEEGMSVWSTGAPPPRLAATGTPTSSLAPSST